jgi:hypothetical protein
VSVNSAPLIQHLRHPRERIVTVGLVRVSSGRGLVSRASSILNSSPVYEWDQASAQIVLPGIPSHTPHLVRLVRTFLHKGEQQPAKGKVSKLINQKIGHLDETKDLPARQAQEQHEGPAEAVLQAHGLALD